MKIILGKGQFLGPISGADEILVNYATELHRNGHDVSVLLLYPHSSEDQYYMRLREAGVAVHTVASNSMRTFLGTGRRLARGLLNALPSSQAVVRKNAQKVATNLAMRYQEQCRNYLEAARPDIVHVLTPDPGGMVLINAASDARVPVIYQEVGIPYHPPDYESYYEQFTTVLPLCAEVAALSPTLAQLCRERLPSFNKLTVLPIIMEDLRNGHHAARDARSDVSIGFAARIEHLKGPLVLLEAFAAAQRECGNLRLVIAGAGPLAHKFEARAAALGVYGRCEFAGIYTGTEMRKSFMQGLDIFALPSLTEGTPNSIVEAMSLGLPIIATDVGGIPDVVTPEAGILVQPENRDALAEAIIRLAADAERRRRMGEAARTRYEKLFTAEAVLPVLVNTYRRIAAGESLESSLLATAENVAHPWAQSESAVCVA